MSNEPEAAQPEATEVELSTAIEALRNALVRAWWDGKNSRVRFRVAPVELTVQIGVTRTGKGAAGVKWHVLTLGGEKSRETENTQTLKLRLAPVLFDDHGNVLADVEQLIADWDDEAAPEEAEDTLQGEDG
jgi:Trypsin-co-occurring domain 2